MEKLEQRDYTKHYIVEALFKLMDSKDFHEISITEISKKAGVGRATFYRNFRDKESIVQYYFSRITANFEQKNKYIPRSEEDYYDIILSTLKTLKSNQDAVKKIIRSRLEYLLLDYLNEGYAASFKNSNKPQNPYLPYAYSGALFNITLEWLKNNCEDDIETIANALFMSAFNKQKK